MYYSYTSGFRREKPEVKTRKRVHNEVIKVYENKTGKS